MQVEHYNFTGLFFFPMADSKCATASAKIKNTVLRLAAAKILIYGSNILTIIYDLYWSNYSWMDIHEM